MSLRYPFSPYPNGWFVIASSDKVGRGQVVPTKRFGRDLVVFRTESGAARVADAYCPHMGTHLGYGGKIDGETIICPAHHRRYDCEGRCVEVPPKGALSMQPGIQIWPTTERNGFIFTYHDTERREPAWQLPEFPTWNADEWTSFEHHERPPSRTSAWEMAADTVDMSHFLLMHNYKNPVVDEIDTDGPIFRAKVRLTVAGDTYGFPGSGDVESTLRGTLYGLGVQFFQTYTDLGGQILQSLTLAMVTPIDEEYSDARYSTAVKKLDAEHVTRFVMDQFVSCAKRAYDEDLPVQANRVYVSRPHLSPHDGPIMRFRSWSEQFYSDRSGFSKDSILFNPPSRPVERDSSRA
ncbi:Rieske 2Fe-2S domain-containing protein [Sorangium sp. So ce887]|uniref:Rieske 2Fe-2S domain-containing protein n=1 Tax=Sorangium sp. So ce887 TaxID=3133324 RepID=UPI003F5F5934